MTDATRACAKCGYPVSMKGSKWANRRRRPDGGYDHVECTNVSSSVLRGADVSEHRRAVRAARLRGDVL